jgi:cell fate regulator YaaT (PSP1 superfamily)
MVEIISVRFKSGGKPYYFNPEGQQFQEGDGVIVETTQGTEYAKCVQGNTMIDEIELMAPLRPVVRKATEEDEKTLLRNQEKEQKAFAICQEKIVEHGLDMKLVEAEYSFEGNKVLFFFTSDGRVDFRALVKDLASTIHARIELRQIGVRDEAKMLGGLGICGRPFCCSQFLDEFQPVSIKMAKTQNLSLNPTKISGTCGRLMCCLKYEQEAYEDLVKHAPKQESFVETPDGAGTVSSVNLLRQTVQVRLDSAPESPKCYHNCELCVIRNGKGKRPEGYVEPSREELAKLRRPEEERPVQREEDALAAALEAAFPQEIRGTESSSGHLEGGEKPSSGNRRSRSRNRRPKGEREEGQPNQGVQSNERRQEKPRRPKPQKQAQPPQERGEKPVPTGNSQEGAGRKPYRRRRRPKGSGGGAPQG